MSDVVGADGKRRAECRMNNKLVSGRIYEA